MKPFFSSALVLGTLLTSLPSYALVELVASCETPDQRYHVTIMDNQGTGFHRSSNLGATVRSGDQTYSYRLSSQVVMENNERRYMGMNENGEWFQMIFYGEKMGPRKTNNATLTAVVNGNPIEYKEMNCTVGG